VPDEGWEAAVCRRRRSQNAMPAMSVNPTAPPAIAPALVFFFDDDECVVVLGVVESVELARGRAVESEPPIAM
jgi:hypothetical protein